MADSIFDKYSPTKNLSVEADTSTNKPEYSGYGLVPDMRSPRLGISFKDGSIKVIRYVDIVEITSQTDKDITLICNNCTICIEGENLHDLMDGLVKEQLLFIECYSEQYAIPKPDQLIITAITIS